ncbi:MAG: WD40 repeat domain-containing protein [Rhizonema sp. PD37]|nr:WD40 repeat domain-containing protein [Rhizonema sp. PD37]
MYGHTSRVNAVAISRQGTTLISSSYDRTVKYMGYWYRRMSQNTTRTYWRRGRFSRWM